MICIIGINVDYESSLCRCCLLLFNAQMKRSFLGLASKKVGGTGGGLYTKIADAEVDDDSDYEAAVPVRVVKRTNPHVKS